MKTKKTHLYICIWIFMCILFTTIFIAPFEGPDEVYTLGKVAINGLFGVDHHLISLIGFENMQNFILHGQGVDNSSFSFATNQCRYLGSRPHINYRLFRSVYSIFPITLGAFVSLKFGLITQSFFLWPSVLYSILQLKTDMFSILLSSLYLSISPKKIIILSVFLIAFLDRSAICILVFAVLYQLFQRVSKKWVIALIVFSVLASIVIETQRIGLSFQVATMVESILGNDIAFNREVIISTSTTYGQNPFMQLLSLVGSIVFLGGSASFYPTPIFYVLFIYFIYRMSRRFKRFSPDKYNERKKDLRVAVASLFVAFFLLRILLPAIGNGRYWLIIVPFVLAYIGADQKINYNAVSCGLILFSFIANLWVFGVWLLTC